MLNHEFIKELKRLNPIVEVAREYFPDLNKVSTNLYNTRCKHQGDKNPSLTFYANNNSFYCYGCGAGSKDSESEGSDVIALVQWMEGCTQYQAIKMLADKVGLKMPEDGEYFGIEKKKIHSENIRYWENLQKDTEALEYIHSRNLSDEDIKKWRIGCTTQEPKKIVLGIMDIYGDTVGFGYRFLRNSDITDKDSKYINSKNSALFNKGKILYGLNYATNMIKESGFAVLVEGFFDVIALQSVGVPAVGSMGTNFTTEQIDLLSQFTSDIMIFFDGDNAGENATEKATILLEKKDINTKIINIHNTDPDDIVKIYGSDTLDFIRDSSVSVYQYKLNKAINNYHSGLSDITRELIKSAIPVIKSIQEPANKIVYISQLNKILGGDYTSLLINN